MILPPEIWVAGMRFLVEVRPSTFTFGTWGYVKIDAPATIMVSGGLDEQLQRETLLHEILHAIDKIGLDSENHLTKALMRETYPRLQEVQVVVFSRMLWATLTDPRNSMAVAWMLCGSPLVPNMIPQIQEWWQANRPSRSSGPVEVSGTLGKTGGAS